MNITTNSKSQETSLLNENIFIKEYFKNHKLEQFINNRQDYIDAMQHYKIEKIKKNYDIVLQQLQIAHESKNKKAYEILVEMESQLLEVIVLKEFTCSPIIS